jgi:hypothetical protein
MASRARVDLVPFTKQGNIIELVTARESLCDAHCNHTDGTTISNLVRTLCLCGDVASGNCARKAESKRSGGDVVMQTWQPTTDAQGTNWRRYGRPRPVDLIPVVTLPACSVARRVEDKEGPRYVARTYLPKKHVARTFFQKLSIRCTMRLMPDCQSKTMNM